MIYGGLGNSLSGDGQYTMESFVDDFFSILDSFEIQKVTGLRTFDGRVSHSSRVC